MGAFLVDCKIVADDDSRIGVCTQTILVGCELFYHKVGQNYSSNAKATSKFLRLLNDNRALKFFEKCYGVFFLFIVEPLPPENFNCISYNWQNLNCTWFEPQNPVKTKYELSYKDNGNSGR